MSNLDSAGNLVAPFVPPGSRAGSSNPSRQPRTPNTELDRNAFLNLLVTQLRHQDPLNPMDDRDFVAQMAQFSSLEQMQNLNTTMTQAASFAMVGNTVAGISQNPVTGAFTNLLGRVESVRLINNEPWLVLGTGADAPMLRASEVEYVMEDFWMSGLLGNMNNGIMNNQNINLVGRIIQAITVDENERPIGFVEGRVDYIDFSGSVPMLMIGNQRVFPSEIVSVSDEMMLIGKQVGFYENGNRRVGNISEVRIIDGNALLVINGLTYEVDRINFVTEAIRLRDSNPPIEITHGNIRGHVADVFVQSGATWIVIDRGAHITESRFQTVKYEDYMRSNNREGADEQSDD